MYASGDGIVRGIDQAIYWYKKSAEEAAGRASRLLCLAVIAIPSLIIISSQNRLPAAK